jgi:hypothetical protein
MRECSDSESAVNVNVLSTYRTMSIYSHTGLFPATRRVGTQAVGLSLMHHFTMCWFFVWFTVEYLYLLPFSATASLTICEKNDGGDSRVHHALQVTRHSSALRDFIVISHGIIAPHLHTSPPSQCHSQQKPERQKDSMPAS